MVVGGVGEFLSLVPLRSNVDVDFLSFYYTSSVVVVVRSIFLAGWLKKKKKRKKIMRVAFKVHRTVALYMCVFYSTLLFRRRPRRHCSPHG